jgi:hypothetical protein
LFICSFAFVGFILSVIRGDIWRVCKEWHWAGFGALWKINALFCDLVRMGIAIINHKRATAIINDLRGFLWRFIPISKPVFKFRRVYLAVFRFAVTTVIKILKIPNGAKGSLSTNSAALVCGVLQKR